MSASRDRRITSPRRSIAALCIGAALIFASCSSDSDDATTNPPDTAVDDGAVTPDPEGTDGATDGSTDDTSDDTTDGTTDDTTNDSGSSESRTGDLIENPPARTWQDALDAANEMFDGGVSKIELEEEDSGRREYKIELISSSEKFAVKFDADTLEELSSKTDDLGDDADEKRNRIFDVGDIISLEEAADIARGEVDGVIEEWKIEGKDDGRIEYEFDIVPEGETDDIEVEIDAKTGEVLEVD